MKSIQRKAFLAAAVALLVTACGGGGGGAADPNPTVPPVGSTKTMIVSGTISGFGSVIVNGVHYDTSGAEVEVEDHAGTLADLKVGQVVRLEAEVDDKGGARAKRVEQNHLIQGTVEAVDVAAGTVTIAGQVILVDNDTSFDDSIPTGSLAGIAVGDRLEINGFAAADGQARATRIEKADASDLEIEVTGTVAGLDTTAKVFRVGTLDVDYSAATLERFGTAGLQDGALVEVKGRSFLPSGALKASRVRSEDDGVDAASGTEAEVEGLVTSFVSASDFDVAGQHVTTNGSTVFVNGTATDLKADIKVEVEGKLDANKVLVASKVSFKRNASVKIAAAIDAIDTAASTITVLGVTVAIDATTRKEDKEGDNQFFAFADLHVGDWVEISGYPDAATAGRIIATRLERDQPSSHIELRGPASDLQAPNLKVAGVNVATTTATRFEGGENDLDATSFFASAANSVVKVEGAWTGSAVVADKVEVERAAGTVVVPPPTTPPTTGNRGPVARAGSARTVTPGTAVNLDASSSTDADGDALTFAWTLTRPATSTAVLSAAAVSNPSFTADVAGTYTATVTVSDGQASSVASVVITAQQAAPTLDGAALYASKCSGCHGSITAIRSMPVGNRTVAGIQSAIAANRGGMGSLSTLSVAELQAIVDAMKAANP